jgi:ABC-type dipeptide/oligopeptide/nickel transport system permease subunit
MERVQTAVSLRPKTKVMQLKPVSFARTIAVCSFLVIMFRVIVLGVTGILNLIPELVLPNQIIETINRLNYLIAIPVGVGLYAVLRSREEESFFIEIVLNLLRKRAGVVGLTLLALLLMMSDFAPVIATHDPIQPLFGMAGETPPLPRKAPCIHLFGCPAEEIQHYMGIDLNARDQFSRVVYAAQTSLVVGTSSVLVAILAGTLLGLVAGYAGGWVDNLIMRLMDVMLAFPALLLAITIVTIRGPGLRNALLAIAIVSIPIYARVTRATVLSIKEHEFITAERCLGAEPWRILFAHILPHALTPLIVQGTLGIGEAVLTAAGLSFVGLGAQPPTPEWGAMLSEARAYVFTSPHLVFFPGFFIMLTVLAFNLLGDGLRDALDPRLNRS